MKKTIKNIISFTIQKISPADLIILNYHQVTPKYNQQFHSPGTWTQSDEFEKELIYLKNNFNLISLRDISESKSIPKNSIAITFDDGFKSIEKYAIPLLEKHNIPATFFINTAYLDTNKASWATIGNYFYFSETLKQNLPKNYVEIKTTLRNTDSIETYNKYKTRIEKLHKFIPENFTFFTNLEYLKTLNANLFAVGLHAHEHQRHSMLNNAEQEFNIKENIRILSVLPTYIPIFAIPYGKPYDWNIQTENICNKYSLKIMSAYGGQNVSIKQTKIFNRIPADSEKVKEIIKYSYFKRLKDKIK